jgi:hypothetical protein
MAEFDVEVVFTVALKAVKDAGEVRFYSTCNSDIISNYLLCRHQF